MMNSFDNRMKEHLSDYSPEVPPHIWENIVAKKKKRRLLFWIWLILFTGSSLVLMTAGPGKDWSGGKDKIENRENAIKVSSGSKAESPDKPIPPDKRPNPEKTDIRSVPATSVMTPDHSDKEQSVQISDSRNREENKSSDISSVANNVKESGSVKSNAAPPNSQIKMISGYEKSKAYTGRNKAGSILPAESKMPENENLSVASGLSHTGSVLAELNQGNFTFLAREDQQLGFNLIPPRYLRQEIPCPERNAAGNKKYLELFAGPDMVFRSFRDTGNSEYLRLRKESTSISFAYSAGARFTRVFNNGMSFRTGITYSHIREKFTLEEGNVILTVYITGPNGDTIGNYSTRGTLYRKSYNRYHSLDIPLLIGYELGNGRLHTNINAGVIVNMYSWQKGMVVDTARKAVNISTGAARSPYQFKSNIGVGFLGSASFYYKLNDRMHLLAEPYFRYNLSSFNKEEITLKQKFHTAGLRLGVRYDLR